MLLAGTGTETEILQSLPTEVSASTLIDAWENTHGDQHATKAYDDSKESPTLGDWSAATPFTFKGKSYSALGYVIEQKQLLTGLKTQSQFYQIAALIANQMLEVKRQSAFGLSLHYRYPHDGRTSGHTLGIFYSVGGPGARKAGIRFFDPNLGSWRFGTTQDFGNFLEKQWFPGFLAGNFGDPNHPTRRRRELTYFRFVGITQA
jgi:hypothetical protein